MNRFFAIACVVLLMALIFASPDISISDVSLSTLYLHSAISVLLAAGMVGYCSFAALHSTQHISSPIERTNWLLLIIALNIFGSCYYYCSLYQQFRKTGQGGFMKPRRMR